MRIFLLAALLLPLVAQAGPLSQSWTVRDFVKAFRPTPNANEPQRTPAEFLQYEKAQGFIDGVKDVTEGFRWCHVPTYSPVEVDTDVYNKLKELSPKQQSRRAGPVIEEKLTLLYPCKKVS
jgi:hypothetical protein